MQEVQDPQNRLPPELMRRYDVVFVPRQLQKTLKLREIGSKNVGRLVTVQVSPKAVSSQRSVFEDVTKMHS